jgi:hypothetical protein
MNEAHVALFISIFNTLIMGFVAIIKQCQQSNCKKITVRCCCCGLTACMEPPRERQPPPIVVLQPTEMMTTRPKIEMIENNI